MTSRSSKFRPYLAIPLFGALSILIVIVLNAVIINVTLLPLNKLHFLYHSKTPLTKLYRFFYTPTQEETSTIGAHQVNRTTEMGLRIKYIKYEEFEKIPIQRPELDLLLSYLRPSDNMLEYGLPTNTTSQLSNFVNTFANIYDDPNVNDPSLRYNRILINSNDHSSSDNINFCLNTLPKYITSVNSIIFFNNYFQHLNTYNSYLLNYYQEVASIHSYLNYSDGLLILKPKPQLFQHTSILLNNKSGMNDHDNNLKLGNADENGFVNHDTSPILPMDMAKSRIMFDFMAFPFVLITYLLIKSLYHYLLHGFIINIVKNNIYN